MYNSKILLIFIILLLIFNFSKKEVNIERFKNDNSNCALLTISVGNRSFLKYTKKNMERYAKKLGVKFIIVDNWLNKYNNPRFMKLDILHFYTKKYDRLIYLDDTVFITPNAPNLFKVVSPQKIGAWKENYDLSKAISYYSKFDLHKFNNKSYTTVNSGVLVIPNKFSYIFNTKNYILKKIDLFYDQQFLSYQINKNNIDVFDIGIKFNCVSSKYLSNILNENIYMYHITSSVKLNLVRNLMLRLLQNRYV